MNTQMKRYSNYVERLERLLEAGPGPSSQDWSARCAAALDGEPSRELRKAISLERRRGAGAFFTGSVLARKAVVRPRRGKECRGKIFDPACGAGDLLLAAARLCESGRRDFLATGGILTGPQGRESTIGRG